MNNKSLHSGKKKLYISLPITGHDIEDVRRTAARIQEMLEKRGYEVVNPLDIYAGENPGYFDHICSYLRALADCDGIFMAQGYYESRGCSLELAFARIYEKEVIYGHATGEESSETCEK